MTNETDPETPTSSGSGDTSHFDGLEVEPEAGAEGEAAIGGLAVTAEGFVPHDIWHAGFCLAFQMAGHVTALQTLLAAPERPEALHASRAIYDTCCEVPALHFMVKPGLKWIERAGAVAAFALPVYAGVRVELRARQAKDVTPQPEPSYGSNEQSDPRPASAEPDRAEFDD